MSHALDKNTVKRILHLHQVQGLKANIIAQRFGYSSSRIHSVIRRQASSSKRALKKPQLQNRINLESNNVKKRS